MLTDDISPFMNVAEFATSVTLQGVTVSAIFDNASALGGVGPYGMAGTQPMITLATADVPTSPVGLTVVASGKRYTVAAHEPDGTGISRLILELSA